MSIQFLCVGCRQPIEVDDVAANQQVTCPYCRNVVTAPAQSDPKLLVTAPVATSTGPRSEIPPVPGLSSLIVDYAAPLPQPPAGTNKLAWASLVFIVLGGVSMLAMSVVAAKAMGPVNGPIDAAEISKRMTNAMQNNPGFQRAYVITFLGTCGFPVLAVGLAIAALVSGKSPRWPAILTLCLLAALVLMMCVGIMNYRGPMPKGVGG